MFQKHFNSLLIVYYEKNRISCYLIYRKKLKQLAVRLIFNRQKTEHKLFDWPEEYWDAENRMILPRGPKDKGYPEAIAQIMQLQQTLLNYAEQSNSVREISIKAHQKAMKLHIVET